MGSVVSADVSDASKRGRTRSGSCRLRPEAVWLDGGGCGPGGCDAQVARGGGCCGAVGDRELGQDGGTCTLAVLLLMRELVRTSRGW